MLMKTRTVLEFQSLYDGSGMRPIFAPTLDDSLDSEGRFDSARRTSVSLDSDVWQDMGRPESITVTVRPGDRLN